jgi:hypothetical protein
MDRPDKLYKFMRFRGDPNASAPNENVQRLVERSDIRVSRAEEFNDPFDCAPIITPFPPEIRERLVVKEMEDPKYDGLPKEARAQIRDHLITVLSVPDASKREHTNTVREWGIYCLCAAYSSVLMWSHYADSHRGICIEFEAHPLLFGAADKVRYSEDRPIADVADVYSGRKEDAIRFRDASLLTKGADWSYEEEYRLLLRHVHGFIDFDAHLLTGIILGSRMQPEDEAKLVEMAETREHQPKLYRAVLHKTKNIIEREPL